MLLKFTSVAMVFAMLFFPSLSFAQDQCNTTGECKSIHGGKATDCKNAKSSKSICMCGSKRCDGTAKNADVFTVPTRSNTNFLARIDPANKKLRYGFYANRREGAKRNIVPDFSHAGYLGGGITFPNTKIKPARVLSPSPGDDWQRIQNAINDVGKLPIVKHGIRGVVLLKKGRYRISKTLELKTTGVVLRGEGQNASGTVIRMVTPNSKKKETVIALGSRAGGSPPQARDARRTKIASAYSPVGARWLLLESSKGYKKGDRIGIVRTPNERWVGPKGVNMAQFGWTTNHYRYTYERRVADIDGNRIKLDAPLVDTIQRRFGGGEVYRIDLSARINRVAVENLRITGDPRTGTAPNVKNEGPYYGMEVLNVHNSWVRSVTFEFLSDAITLRNGAYFNTFQDVAYVDPRFAVVGGNRYPFHIIGRAAFNLFNRCYAREGRHSVVTGNGVAGPNVFLDCLIENHRSDDGPHHRWATGTLYDNIKTGLMRVQNRQDSGSGHGWAGAQNMFWNVEAREVVVQAPQFAMNWSVGHVGEIRDGNFVKEPRGIFQDVGKNVTPRSLYLQQLKERLGNKAVKNITRFGQDKQRIWNKLQRNYRDGVY